MISHIFFPRTILRGEVLSGLVNFVPDQLVKMGQKALVANHQIPYIGADLIACYNSALATVCQFETRCLL